MPRAVLLKPTPSRRRSCVRQGEKTPPHRRPPICIHVDDRSHVSCLQVVLGNALCQYDPVMLFNHRPCPVETGGFGITEVPTPRAIGPDTPLARASSGLPRQVLNGAPHERFRWENQHTSVSYAFRATKSGWLPASTIDTDPVIPSKRSAVEGSYRRRPKRRN